MSKNQDQFAFDFQVPPHQDAPVADFPGGDGPVTLNGSSHVAVYYLEHRRIAKIKRESANHFSAILNLVAHLK
ncbi:MAG: hypothetical protein WDO17_07225 [Alphaproteobacteria bacterium]